MNCKKSMKPSMTNTTKYLIQKRGKIHRRYPHNKKLDAQTAREIWALEDCYNYYPLAAIKNPDGKILLDDGQSIDILDL